MIDADVLTLPEMAAELGCSPATLRAQVANGRLEARKAGTVWLVTRAEVERYRRESSGKPGRRVQPPCARCASTKAARGPVGFTGAIYCDDDMACAGREREAIAEAELEDAASSPA